MKPVVEVTGMGDTATGMGCPTSALVTLAARPAQLKPPEPRGVGLGQPAFHGETVVFSLA